MPTAAPSDISQRLAHLIQQFGLTKNAFALSLDRTASVVQHLIDGRNKPGYDLLCKIFAVYPNVSRDWLLLGQGPMLLTAKKTAAASAPEETAVIEVPAAVAENPPLPLAAPVPAELPAAAPPAAAALPETYLAAALHAQHLQHQLAMAEMRNRHLLEQQQLLREMLELARKS